MILAIETSDVLCSVAFWSESGCLAEYNHELPMQHATLVGELVQRGLAFLSDPSRKQTYTVDDLTSVAVSIGPGSFTGLRIGLGYVQGFCFGRALGIVGISNHQILAHQRIKARPKVYTMIEARREEVYVAEMIYTAYGYPEIKTHNILQKKDITNLPPRCQLICKKDMVLSETMLEGLNKREILLNQSANFYACYLAELAHIKSKYMGMDDLDKLEPMYIRPFAGMK